VIRLPAAITLTGRVNRDGWREVQLAEAVGAPSPRPSRRCPGTAANWPPAEMPAMETGTPVTRSGVEWPAVVPSPSCPSSLLPHAHTECDRGDARCSRGQRRVPARTEMPVTWDRPAILTGTETGLKDVVPLPIWSEPVGAPGEHDAVRAQRQGEIASAEILVTRFSTATRAGTSSPLLVVPRPSWPWSFRPRPTPCHRTEGQAELLAGRHLRDDPGQAPHLDRRGPVGMWCRRRARRGR